MADRLNDIVYADDKKETADVINLLFLGWILLGLVVYILGNVIATQVQKRKSKTCAQRSSENTEPAEEPVVVQKTANLQSAPADLVTDEFLDSSVIFSAPGESGKIPKCSGDDIDYVSWINDVISWIYVDRVVSPILEAWLSALNARTRLLSTEHGILVDFQSIMQSNQVPLFQEAFESIDQRNEVNVSMQAEILNVEFEIVVTQVKEKDKNIFRFLLNLNRLAGQLNIVCDPEDLSFHIQFAEGSQVQFEVEANPSNVIPPEEYQVLHSLICEISTEALKSSGVDLHLSSFPDCPKYAVSELASGDDLIGIIDKDKEEKLHVKIVQADNLGGSRGCSKPYCVVEMDEPPQRFETKSGTGTSPVWEESFVFFLQDISAELLIEIYDKDRQPNENFLGLGIVSLEELMRNPSQCQVISLQSRPLEKDDVTGSLIAEFSFIGWDLSESDVMYPGQTFVTTDDGSGKIVETNSRITSGGTIITTTTIKRTKEGASNREKVPESNESPQKIQKELTRVISNSRQKFLNELIHNGPCDGEMQKSTNENVQNMSDGNAEISGKLQQKTGNGAIGIGDNTSTPIINNSHNGMCNGIQNDVSLQNGNIQVCLERNTKAHTECNSCSLESNEIFVQNRKEIAEIFHVNSDDSNQKMESNIVSHNSNILHDDSNTCDHLPKPHDTKKHENDNTLTACVKENLHAIQNEIDEQESDSIGLPSIAEEAVDLSSSTSTLVENKVENEASDLTNTALKELEKQENPGSTSVSTLIIHSVQRIEPSRNGNLEASPGSHLSTESRSSPHLNAPPSPSIQRNGIDRSRPKEKKSIISNLRKKLSFRKPRSRSAEDQERDETSPVPIKEHNRSVSTERMKSTRDTASLKSGRPLVAVPASTRSSFSEASGLSTTSSRTYINENSTLVIEINENGIIKRYLIPTSMIHRSKWKKKGLKLHLYNDHVFIAKHLSGLTLCQVCKKTLTRRPGKQGYECRDCKLQCHKSCHVRVPDYCPNSSVSSMEVYGIPNFDLQRVATMQRESCRL